MTANTFPKRIRSWPDLAGLIDHFSHYNGVDWLFRGVTDANHDLVPTIGRDTRKLKSGSASRIPYKEEDEKAVLTMFKQQARAYLPTPPQPIAGLEWLAIAQHFGLPTRILDWTDSFIVSAFFAVLKSGTKRKGTDSAIWVTRGVEPVNDDEALNPFALNSPKIYRPPHITPRISAQGSVLMVCPRPTTPVALDFQEKIVIAQDAEFTLKKRLNACGINTRILFPDLPGLSAHLDWVYKNNYLAGYKASSTKV